MTGGDRPYHHGDLKAALLAAAEAELAERGIEAFSLRAVAKRAGVSLDWTFEQAAADLGSWAILKGAPHPKAAQAFIDFYMANPANHAAFSREMGYATTNRAASDMLTAVEKRELGSSPDVLAGMASINADWVEANRTATLERWNRWLSA